MVWSRTRRFAPNEVAGSAWLQRRAGGCCDSAPLCDCATCVGHDAEIRAAGKPNFLGSGLDHSDGLKFPNREPVRPRDCATSLTQWSVRDTMGQTLAKFVGQWRVQDDRTLRITPKPPFPLLIDAPGKPAAHEP